MLMCPYESYLSLSFFNQSSIMLRAEEILRYGFFIDHFYKGNIVIHLYSYNDFYVELVYDTVSESIDQVRGITIEEALDNYLSGEQDIEINALIED